MFYAIKFVIILIIMFTNLRKCEIVKHKIVFKNVGNRFPKVLTILGLLAGMNLLKNFHVEAGKQDFFGKQFNTLTFEFETEQTIGSNSIETIIHGNSEQLYPFPPFSTSQYSPKQSHDKNFLKSIKNIDIISTHHRKRRSLENLKKYSSEFSQGKQVNIDEENLVNNTKDIEIITENEQISESPENQNLQAQESSINNENVSSAIAQNTNLNMSNVPQTLDLNNTGSEGYIYVRPTIITPHDTYGTPPDNSINGYFYPQPPQDNPNLSYGPPIYNLSPPSQQDPQQFRPTTVNTMYGLPNHWFSLSDTTNSNVGPLYQIKWPFCLSYHRFPANEFKPSLPDFNRDQYESYYNNYNGYKPINGGFLTNWF